MKPGLGRGLNALLGTPVVPAAIAPMIPDNRERVERVPVTQLRPCPLQPRQQFSAESLAELAASIKEQGIVQPLIARKRGDHFEIIAGERRWRAAQSISLTEVP